ncbi:NET1-associated nuclear protein 1 [Tilletia horrida]|nr:NET1-associated nuclear protein 1 [Tilletia horrida]
MPAATTAAAEAAAAKPPPPPGSKMRAAKRQSAAGAGVGTANGDSDDAAATAAPASTPSKLKTAAPTPTPSRKKKSSSTSTSSAESPLPQSQTAATDSPKSKNKSKSSNSKNGAAKGKDKSGSSSHAASVTVTATTSPPAKSLAWHSLADPAVYSSEPPLFTPDGAYYFIPTSSTIRIVSRHTGTTISTLTPPALPTNDLKEAAPAAAADGEAAAPASTYRHHITALALHPSNPLQLLCARTDGTISIWDYLDARLLRVLFLASSSAAEEAALFGAGMPITHLVASEACPDWAFVSARRPKGASSSARSRTQSTYSTILLAVRLSVRSSAEPIVSLSLPGSDVSAAAATVVPVYVPQTQSRLGKIKLIPSAMRLSPHAEHLVVVGGRKIHVASLRRAPSDQNTGMDVDVVEGSGSSSASSPKFNISCPDGLAKFTTSDTLTTLAIHPTENSIATGDVTGKIRIFHGILEEDFLARRRSADEDADGEGEGEAAEEAPSSSKQAKSGSSKKKNKAGAAASFFGAPSTVLHWHAHAVSTLAYVPLAATGARLLSGGEEATLVLWHIQAGGGGAGRVQKEFVPRLGAAIASVCLAGASAAPTSSAGAAAAGGVEEEIVCALRDGALIFLNPANLRVLRTFARLKTDAGRLLFPAWRQRSMPAPLALQPTFSPAAGYGFNLVLGSGHPSTIQFYDPVADALVSELEVVSSNRVSRPDEAPIEPARVELVAFSPLPTPGAASSSSSAAVPPAAAEWMATLDARRPFGASLNAAPRFASEISLKFWAWDAEAGRYVLCTSIDRPHGDEGTLSDLSFGWIGENGASSSTPRQRRGRRSFENLVCVSTGSDGKIKTWRPLPLARSEGLGAATAAASKRKDKKKKAGLGDSDPAAYHWVARSILSFRCTLPRAIAWAPDHPSTSSALASASLSTLGPSSTSGLVAVAQGAFVTLWQLDPRANSLVAALCAPQLVEKDEETLEKEGVEAAAHLAIHGGRASDASAAAAAAGLVEGAQTCAFVGRGGRFVAGASAHVCVVWDLLSGSIVWSKSYKSSSSSPTKRKDAGGAAAEDDSTKQDSIATTKTSSRKMSFRFSIARILPIAPGTPDGAEEVFGLLLTDAQTRSSRVELFDLGGLLRKHGHTRPHEVLSLPFVVRSLALLPGLAPLPLPAPPAPAGTQAQKQQGGRERKVQRALSSIAAYVLSSDFEPLQLGQPAALALASPSASDETTATADVAAMAIMLPRVGAEDVVRARRVRTILDDLLGGGQAFLPDTFPSASSATAKANEKAAMISSGGGTETGDVFRLFEAPAHLLPPMPTLFDAFSRAILPKRVT